MTREEEIKQAAKIEQINMNTLLIGITATIIIFKVQNGLTNIQEKDFGMPRKLLNGF